MADSKDFVAEGNRIYQEVTRKPDSRQHVLFPMLDDASARGLVVALESMASTGVTGERMHAKRDALMTYVQVKVAEQQIGTMERLDRSAATLKWLSVLLSAVGAFVGFTQFVGC